MYDLSLNIKEQIRLLFEIVSFAKPFSGVHTLPKVIIMHLLCTRLEFFEGIEINCSLVLVESSLSSSLKRAYGCNIAVLLTM